MTPDSTFAHCCCGCVTRAIGLLMGVGVSTFVYVRGGSYLTDKPKACVYCHVMREQSAGWIKAAPVR